MAYVPILSVLRRVSSEDEFSVTCLGRIASGLIASGIPSSGELRLGLCPGFAELLDETAGVTGKIASRIPGE